MSTTSDRAASAALLLVACLLVLAGCGGSDGDGDRAGTTATSPPPSTQTTPPARPLPAEWYEDPDGDLVPTAVERETGADPAVDECAEEAGCGEAAAVSALERSNTLLILDSSGSMAGSAGGGTTKLVAAKRALRRYVAGVPDSLALGFMVYGHKGSNDAAGKAESCRGVELLDPIGKAASRRFDRTLRRFKATGYTPLGAALRKARDAFAGKEDAINRIILVTDGIETCGGNPVEEARKLKQADIEVTTDVVGFDVAEPAEARRLRVIAEASGGEYSDARTARDLSDYFREARGRVADLSRQLLCISANAGRVSRCQGAARGRSVRHMLRASADASRAGRKAESAEIDRLRKALDAAAGERDERLDDESEATSERLEREIAEAKRRLDRLGP